MNDALPSWQTLLKDAITSVEALLSLTQIPAESLSISQTALQDFPLLVTQGFAQKIEKGNARDPLLLQILPVKAEADIAPGFSKDPLEENAYNPLKGLIHKYPNRVLITLVGQCAINCRYCFRRHFPYRDNNPGSEGWKNILSYLENHPQISEVIFSGGDPLLAKDSLLQEKISSLEKIPHLKRLRIHSRVPIVLPERITPGFIDILKNSSLKSVLVMHCNHPQELDSSIANAMKSLKNAGITLLNQTVLLKDVNDSADILKKLSEDLFEMDILPYYLHILDKVQGASHFDLSLEKAKALHNALLCLLPGYLVPKLVVEKPGVLHKVLV